MRPVFEFRNVTLAETDKLISSLKNSQSSGHDGLDTLAFKSATSNLLIPVQHLINLSLRRGKVAHKWKFSAITPLLKSKDLDPTVNSSFRPVAVLTTTSKLIERVVQQQLLDFFENTGQMNPSSHAYRKNSSTTTTLTDILDELYQGMEDNKITSLMAVDQSSAFNCVDRDILLEKLARYNVGMTARNWVCDYLIGRTQYVKIGTARSRMSTVTTGVPQGLVVGPLLFAIMINDMTETVKDRGCPSQSHSDKTRLFGFQCSRCGILSLYADDSTFTISSNTRVRNQVALIRNLDEIGLYLNDNKLAINTAKTQLTECMISQKRTRTQGSPPTLEVEKEPGVWKTVEDSSYIRILGANIKANMTWQFHMESGDRALLPILRKQMGYLKHIGVKIPRTCRNNLAKGLIQSRMSYLMPLWGGASNQLLNRTQVVLNKAARWCTGLGRRTKVAQLMAAAGWMNVKEQITLSTAIYTWKVIHYKKPLRMLDRFNLTDEWKLDILEPRLQFSRNCYRWRAAAEWNAIPQSIRMEKSIAVFKRNMKRHILEQRHAGQLDPGD